jgi:hypothetical protein
MQCEAAQCCNETNACLNTQGCFELLQCAYQCAANPDEAETCYQTNCSAYQAAEQPALAYDECMATKCAADCG